MPARLGRVRRVVSWLRILWSAPLLSAGCRESATADGPVDKPVEPPGVVNALRGAGGALTGANVLLLTLDTTRADHLGCYGASGVETPALDRLAREGLQYLNAHAVAPITLPTHSSIHTGLYPARHGARVNGVYKLPPEKTTIAERLSAAGYRTGAFPSAFVLHRQYGLSQGFDTYNDEGLTVDSSRSDTMPERSAAATTDLALEFLQSVAGDKFFLWVHYYDPHHTYAAPPPYGPRFVDHPYDGEIAYMDSQLARLLDALETMRVADNTLVVAVADHGEGLFDHGEGEHGLLTYESTLHVPLIIRGGPRLPPGQRVADLVSQVDIAPTILGLLGLGPMQEVDGRDLTQVDAGRPVFFENLHAMYSFNCTPAIGMIDGPLKLIQCAEHELYNLREDPREAHDLAPRETESVQRLSQRLDEEFGPNALSAGGATVTPTAADMKALEALGYLASSANENADESERLDPRRVVEALARIDRALRIAPAEGRAQLTALAEEMPDCAPVWRGLGDLEKAANDLPKAEEAYEKCVALAFLPGNAFALAEVKANLAKLEEAKEVLERILHDYPDHLQASFLLGEILAVQGDRDRALDLMHTGLSTDASLAKHVIAAMTREAKEELIAPFVEAYLERYPEALSVRRAAIALFISKREFPLVERLYRDGVKTTPADGDLIGAYAAFLATCPDPKVRDELRAIDVLEQYQRDHPKGDAAPLLALSSIYASRGLFGDALRVAEVGLARARESNNTKLVAGFERHLARVRASLGQPQSQPAP